MSYRIRTITAGVTLSSLEDQSSIKNAIKFLEEAKARFTGAGHEVQTLRIATQHLHEIVDENLNENTINHLISIDHILGEHDIMLSVGELISGDIEETGLAGWAGELVKQTSNISFSISVASSESGIHYQSMLTAAAVCKALAENSPVVKQISGLPPAPIVHRASPSFLQHIIVVQTVLLLVWNTLTKSRKSSGMQAGKMQRQD